MNCMPVVCGLWESIRAEAQRRIEKNGSLRTEQDRQLYLVNR